MTIAQFIAQTYAKLRRQGGFGIDPDSYPDGVSCEYRVDGRNCAIGVWLSESQLDFIVHASDNQTDVRTLMENRPQIEKSLLALIDASELDPRLRPALFCSMQRAHDKSARHNPTQETWADFRHTLRELAAEYGVTL